MSVANTIANARTWVSSFAGPCAWLAGCALLCGLLLGGWVAWRIQDGRVARAELHLAEFKAEIAKANADQLAKNETINNTVSEGYGHVKDQINSLAMDIASLRAGVRLCASTSQMRISQSTSTTDAATTGTVARPAADVLQDLAAEFARRADEAAAQHNALIEWVEKHQDKAAAP